MKSERPHIQESNLLADKIEGFVVKIRERMSLIIAGLVLGVVALIGYGIYQNVSHAQTSRGWAALYFSDTDTADLESVANDFANSPAGHWARQAAGDAHLAKGIENVFVNRDIADQHYQNAIAEYEKITTKAREDFLLSRAYFGLAQAYEGLGKREEAIESYRKIAGLRLIDPGFVNIASNRADWLESKEGEEFVAWFTANRQAAPAIVPPMGDRPPLPDAPTIEFSEPAPATEEAPKEEAPSEEVPKAETPEVTEEKNGSE